jgi:uncharacterized membrane protein
VSNKKLELDRIVFFSDAVFAIAITLLAVNIKLPRSNNHLVAAPLSHYLVDQLPQYQSFLISFLVIGMYWMGHHHYFRYIKSYNYILVCLNIGFLMCITFLPFSTAILDSYRGQRLAVGFYAGSMAVTGLMNAMVWWYASGNPRLVTRSLHPRLIHSLTYQTLVPPFVFLCSIVIDIFNPVLAQFSWLCIALLFVCLKLFRKRLIA